MHLLTFQSKELGKCTRVSQDLRLMAWGPIGRQVEIVCTLWCGVSEVFVVPHFRIMGGKTNKKGPSQ